MSVLLQFRRVIRFLVNPTLCSGRSLFLWRYVDSDVAISRRQCSNLHSHHAVCRLYSVSPIFPHVLYSLCGSSCPPAFSTVWFVRDPGRLVSISSVSASTTPVRLLFSSFLLSAVGFVAVSVFFSSSFLPWCFSLDGCRIFLCYCCFFCCRPFLSCYSRR